MIIRTIASINVSMAKRNSGKFVDGSLIIYRRTLSEKEVRKSSMIGKKGS